MALSTSVWYTIYGYTKIIYKNDLHVIRRCHYTENRFSAISRRYPIMEWTKTFLGVMKCLWRISTEMHPKMVIGYTGFGKGTIVILKQLSLSDREIIEKLWSMPLYDIRYQLYEYTIYESFDYTIACYKRNPVYDNTLLQTWVFIYPLILINFEHLMF